MVLRYQHGLFLPIAGEGVYGQAVNAAVAEDIFLQLLRRFTKENRFVSHKPSSNYAPALFAREEEARRAPISGKGLEAAMLRLFKAGKIWNEQCGKPSRPSYRIAVKAGA